MKMISAPFYIYFIGGGSPLIFSSVSYPIKNIDSASYIYGLYMGKFSFEFLPLA